MSPSKSVTESGKTAANTVGVAVLTTDVDHIQTAVRMLDKKIDRVGASVVAVQVSLAVFQSRATVLFGIIGSVSAIVGVAIVRLLTKSL